MIDVVKQWRQDMRRAAREWRLKNPQRSKDIRKKYREKLKADPLRRELHKQKAREYGREYRVFKRMQVLERKARASEAGILTSAY